MFPRFRSLVEPLIRFLDPYTYPEAMPRLKGLLESALFVKDLQRSRSFYARVLGLQTIQESDVGCVFAVAHGQLLLLISDEKARVSSTTPGGDVPPCLVGPGETLGAGILRSQSPKSILPHGGLAWRAKACRC
jgi:catechol 2,3-dioxygenase-like lactoylglutathione lyase family enzyme